jgi:Na+/H+ antiporter NhaD/arsenite permease-like protein
MGSAANIVSLGMLERQKRAYVRLLQGIKPWAVVVVSTLLVVAMLPLYICKYQLCHENPALFKGSDVPD